MSDAAAAEPIYRYAGPDEAPAILRVIEAAFDRWPPYEIGVPPLEHLRWKMTPPGIPHDNHAVVELRGEIVGVELRWTGRIDVRGIEYPYDFGTDLSVHSSARGQGLGSLLRDGESPRTFAGTVGFDTAPDNQQIEAMYNDRGPVHRPLTIWSRPLGARAFVGVHRSAGIAHLAGATATAIVRGIRARLAGDTIPPGMVEPVTAFDERVTDLWNRVRRDFDLARVRTAEYLNWRYLDSRAGRIAAYQLVDGDRVAGYVAVRRDGDRGRVLDLVTDPAVEGAGAALLERAVADLEGSSCAAVECLLPVGHRDEAALRAAGFLPTGEERLVRATRARHQGVPQLIEVFTDPAARVHLMAGDFDHQ
jgi:GNAT superfamily N-acetyltransferase